MHAFACYRQGHSHKKTGRPCQDRAGFYSDAECAIAAVSDGHGASDYLRTDSGAEFAVNLAVAAVREFVHSVKEDADFAALLRCKDRARLDRGVRPYLEQLSKNILTIWHKWVEEEVRETPFTSEELLFVSERYRRCYTSSDAFEWAKAYGATLLVVCSTKQYWFGLQIGDGRCVAFSRNGEAFEPIPWDEECRANITTSLCDADAGDEFRFCFDIGSPAAVFIGSDGIDNSYVGIDDLKAFYRSVLSVFLEHGSEDGEREVQDYLPRLSELGSGDDVSVAGLICSDLSLASKLLIKARGRRDESLSAYENAVSGRKEAADRYDYVCRAVGGSRNMDRTEAVERVERARRGFREAENNEDQAEKRFRAAEAVFEHVVRLITLSDDRSMMAAYGWLCRNGGGAALQPV